MLAEPTNIFKFQYSRMLEARVIPQIRISRFLYAYFIHGNSMLSATHPDFTLNLLFPSESPQGEAHTWHALSKQYSHFAVTHLEEYDLLKYPSEIK